MKVAASIRDVYESRLEVYERLKNEVDTYFQSKKKPRWHYESRVKTLDSFCLKIETGRFEKASELEDFFAASIVVENSTELEAAITLIKEKYEISYKRPRDNSFTHKAPGEFLFDDIRLYVQLKEDPTRRPKGFENIIFEVQVKTFLQHAWSIATHDLIYKGDVLSWSSSRIAFQVKAMLEHAELAIMESSNLSNSELLKKSNKDFDSKNKISLYLKETWNDESLPVDVVRLSTTINEIIRRLSLTWGEVKEICRKSHYIGKSPKLNLSPYSAIIVSILLAKEDVVTALMEKGEKLFLPTEVMNDLPPETINKLQKITFDAI